EGATPVAALREGAAIARGRWREMVMLVATAFSGVLVFVLLAGILLGIVMSIAGMSPHPGSMMVGFSRILLAGVIAIPVVWLGAVLRVGGVGLGACGLPASRWRPPAQPGRPGASPGRCTRSAPTWACGQRRSSCFPPMTAHRIWMRSFSHSRRIVSSASPAV